MYSLFQSRSFSDGAIGFSFGGKGTFFSGFRHFYCRYTKRLNKSVIGIKCMETAEVILKKCIFAILKKENMSMRNRLLKHIFCLICFVGVLFSASCQTSRNQTHKSSRYQTSRTRHTPNWNASTSQRTTYYIKKNSTRKNHGRKTIKNRTIVERSHDANRSHGITKSKPRKNKRSCGNY